MANILFICYGNVARSQMAEAYYNYFTHSETATSAGVDPMVSHRFSSPCKEAVQVMLEEGVDIHHQLVKVVTQSMVDSAERIYIMAEKTECPPFLLSSSKVEFWTIEDPYGGSFEDFRVARDLIKEHILAIAPPHSTAKVDHLT